MSASLDANTHSEGQYCRRSNQHNNHNDQGPYQQPLPHNHYYAYHQSHYQSPYHTHHHNYHDPCQQQHHQPHHYHHHIQQEHHQQHYYNEQHHPQHHEQEPEQQHYQQISHRYSQQQTDPHLQHQYAQHPQHANHPRVCGVRSRPDLSSLCYDVPSNVIPKSKRRRTIITPKSTAISVVTPEYDHHLSAPIPDSPKYQPGQSHHVHHEHAHHEHAHHEHAHHEHAHHAFAHHAHQYAHNEYAHHEHAHNEHAHHEYAHHEHARHVNAHHENEQREHVHHEHVHHQDKAHQHAPHQYVRHEAARHGQASDPPHQYDSGPAYDDVRHTYQYASLQTYPSCTNRDTRPVLSYDDGQDLAPPSPQPSLYECPTNSVPSPPPPATPPSPVFGVETSSSAPYGYSTQPVHVAVSPRSPQLNIIPQSPQFKPILVVRSPQHKLVELPQSSQYKSGLSPQSPPYKPALSSQSPQYQSALVPQSPPSPQYMQAEVDHLGQFQSDGSAQSPKLEPEAGQDEQLRTDIANSFANGNTGSLPWSNGMLVKVLTSELEQLCGVNQAQMVFDVDTDGVDFGSVPADLQVFFSPNKQPFQLEFYMTRLIEYANCSSAAFVIMLIYIDRIHPYCDSLKLTEMNCHRMALATLVLAIKYIDDEVFSNAHYSRVGGVTPKEMNQLESKLLQVLDWKLAVSPEEYAMYEDGLMDAASGMLEAMNGMVPMAQPI